MEQNGTHRELALGLGHGFGVLVTAAFLGHHRAWAGREHGRGNREEPHHGPAGNGGAGGGAGGGVGGGQFHPSL